MQNDMTQHTVDTLGAKAGAIMVYGGSGGTILAGLTLTEWGVVVGIFTAIAGLIIQFYFKWREDQRQVLYWDEKRREERGE